jgi:hypothetical protein
MQLTSRRRVLAAACTATLAIVLAAVASGRGCTSVDGSPDAAARAFVSAARAGDRRAAYALLGPATRQALERAAADATEKVGGSRRFEAADLLEVGVSAASWSPVGYEVTERQDARAVVVVEGPSGQRDRLTVVRVDGRWRVELEGL